MKPLKLQPIRKGGGTSAAYRAFITAKVHQQLYRLVHTLFSSLQRWDADLCSGGGVTMAGVTQLGRAAPGGGHIRTKTSEEGLLLEVHCAQSSIIARGMVVINFRLACLELHTNETADGLPGTHQYGATKCLRTVHSLDEAVAALQVKSKQIAPASPSSSPSKTPGSHSRSALPFHSPSKPPRRSNKVADLIREGVAMVQGCSSAQLREGATMLQSAAATPGGAIASIEGGAMEALVAAASTVLPSTIMGTAEQLTLLALTIAALLDGDSEQRGRGAARLVAALVSSLHTACANPVLLFKILLALLQRRDVRLEALRQGLWNTISAAYLRKTPLLEPLAAALLSPSVVTSAWKQRQAAHAASTPEPTRPSSPDGQDSPSPTPQQGKLSVPRLLLPSEGDPQASTPAGGLTRATRRELSATPSDWHPLSAPWGSPQSVSAAKDASASSEMEGMAEALGESLMAMDLPSVVAHKRRADMLHDSESEGSQPMAELLEGALLTARQHTLQAHAIFTTARSLQSLDSSTMRSSTMRSAASVFTTGRGSDPSGEAVEPRDLFSVGVADAAEVKNLLLQAMLASLPLPVPHYGTARGEPPALARDPAPILAAEVLSMPTSGLPPHQETLRASCLQLLARIALRQEGSQGGEGPGRSPQHVFLAATGAKLSQLLAGGAQTSPTACAHAAHLMTTAAEYAVLVDSPSVSVAAVQHCLGPISLALTALQGGGAKPKNWIAATWQLLHGLTVFLAPLIAQCADADAGRSFIATVMGDYKAAAMLVAVADLLFLRPGELGDASIAATKAQLPALQRDLLSFFSALAGLLARQPAILDGGAPGEDPGVDVLVIVELSGRGQRRKLTRQHALSFFSFLICPSVDFVRRVLDHYAAVPAVSGGVALPQGPPTGAVRLRPALFDLLKSLFGAPGSPFIADKTIAGK